MVIISGALINNINSIKCEDYASQLEALSFVGERPLCCGNLKCQPEDFRVEEMLGFDFSHEGEHIYLHIEKRLMTTLDLQQAISRFAKCHVRDVGYSGLKDKHAITRQWFSVYLPRHEPKTKEQLKKYWQAFELTVNAEGASSSDVRLLEVCRHNKKLRKGTHKFNRFSLCIRDISTDSSISNIDLKNDLTDRICKLTAQGFPNYFGEQRFGYNNGNLLKAERMFSGSRRVSRSKRSLYISAVRSFLFNLQLSQRVSDNTWLSYIEGDILILNGSNSFFSIEAESLADIERRLKEVDIHISGVLYGENYSAPLSDAGERELAIIQKYPKFHKGLVAAAVKSSRRALRVMPNNLNMIFDCSEQNRQLTLNFDLPPGSYATMLVRELVNVSDVKLERA